MSFYESPRFPTRISFGSSGGPEFRTTVIETWSGREVRNQDWSYPRCRYNIRYGIRNREDGQQVIDHFWAMSGRLHGFRYKDWADYKSCAPYSTAAFGDQSLGTGDGSDQTFQLRKTYTRGSASFARPITKPVSGTVTIGVNGTQATSGWSVSTTTGIVTFTAAPTTGATITAGFEFDVPVRFETDVLEVALAHEPVWQTDVMLVEIRV